MMMMQSLLRWRTGPRPPKAVTVVRQPLQFAARRYHRAAPAADHAGSVLDLAFERHTPDSFLGDAAEPLPLVVVHGLFGSAQNWRRVARNLANSLGTTVFALDHRNHGSSPFSHGHQHTFHHMSKDVSRFLDTQGIKKCTLVGHSMGGKVAMTTALLDSRVARLVVVDSSPVKVQEFRDVRAQLEGMMHVNRSKPASLQEADAILRQYVEEKIVRQFLFTNFKPQSETGLYECRLNLEELHPYIIREVNQFPIPIDGQAQFEGPTLAVLGSRSHYVPESVRPSLRMLFPNIEYVELDAGHWVQAERPTEFVDTVCRFVRQHPNV